MVIVKRACARIAFIIRTLAVMVLLQFVVVNIHGVVKHAAVIVHQSNFVVYVMKRNVSSILQLVSNAISKYAISLAHVLNALMVNSVRNVSHTTVLNAHVIT